MIFRFHRWLKIGMELDVEADSLAEAREKAEREIEDENTADMETETSGLVFVKRFKDRKEAYGQLSKWM